MGYKHGGKGTRLYEIWKGMRRRCNNKHRRDSHLYSLKGIKVCEEWNDFANFRTWSYANGYDDTLSIERIDNDYGYSPTNCKWIPINQQGRNTSQNVFITLNGETKIISDWATQFGLNIRSVMWRYEQGWPIEKLFIEKQVTMKGKHHSEETKKKLSQHFKGENSPRYGIKCSDETKLKMSLAKKGKPSPHKVMLSNEEVEDLINLYKQYKNVERIARETKYSRKVISRILKENNVR